MWGGKSDSLRNTDLPGSALVEVSGLITAHEQSFFECKCMAFVGWCTLTVSIVIIITLADCIILPWVSWLSLHLERPNN